MVLHRHTLSGDHGLVIFVIGCGLLYLQTRANNPELALQSTAEILTSYLFTLGASTVAYRLSPYHPLAKFPGPFLWRVSSVPLAVISFIGHRHLVLDSYHRKYGRFVRIG